MKGSIGIKLSAVVVVLGSLLSILLGGFLWLNAPALSQELARQPYGVVGLWMGVGMFLGGGLWGLVTAVGLFRLQYWARISLLLFSGLLASFAALGLLMLLVVPVISPEQAPGTPEDAVRRTIFVFYFLQLVIAAVWLVQFNRAAVKSQFSSQRTAAAEPACPLSIAVIAWLSLIGGILLLLPAYYGWPASLFVWFLRGWMAVVTYLAVAGLSLYLGWGFLKLRASAWKLGIYTQIFFLAHILVFTFWPGWESRVQTSLGQLPPELRAGAEAGPLTNQWWFSMVLSLGGPVAILWFLIRERAAFQRRPPAPTRPSAS